MRLAFPSQSSLGLWELVELNAEEGAAEAEEGCRLVYVAASRAAGPPDPQRHLQAERDLEPAEERAQRHRALRRLLPALRRARMGLRRGRRCIASRGRSRSAAARPLADAELAVRDLRARRRARRRARAPISPAARRAADGDRVPTPPPLLDARPAAVPVGHLSYSAVSLYERCGYRFYVERVLGARESLDSGTAADRGGEDEARSPTSCADPALAAGARRSGSATPSTPRSNGARADGWAPPGRRAARAPARRARGSRGDPEASSAARALVDGWLESPLLRRARDGTVGCGRGRRSCSASARRSSAARSTCSREPGRDSDSSSTTRPTRSHGRARPSSATATERSARSTRCAAGRRQRVLASPTSSSRRRPSR